MLTKGLFVAGEAASFLVVAALASNSNSAIIIAAIIAASGSIAATVLSLMNRAKIEDVHVLVNSQLTEVMDKLKAVTAERDQLAPDRAGQDPVVEIPPDPAPRHEAGG